MSCRFKDTHRMKAKRIEKDIPKREHAEVWGGMVGWAYRIRQNRLESKTITKNTMIKESIHQEDITIINIHLLSIRTPKYMKHILTELREK